MVSEIDADVNFMDARYSISLCGLANVWICTLRDISVCISYLSRNGFCVNFETSEQEIIIDAAFIDMRNSCNERTNEREKTVHEMWVPVSVCRNRTIGT